MNTRVITLTKVNIRKGPGMVYDEVDRVLANTSFTATEFKKDAVGLGWYKIDKGWICSKYVTLAEDIKVNNEKTTKKGGPRSAFTADDDIGVTSSIVSTGQSTKSRSISESVLGDESAVDGIGTGSLTQPADAMKDLFLSRRIYGLPYQFRDSVDMRMGTDSDNILGIGYREAMCQIPTISFLPGKPSFLPDLSADKKAEYLKGFSEQILKPLSADRMFETFLKDESVDMKFFSFEPDYTSYIRYVNTLCWIFAIYLKIGDCTVPGETSSSKVGDLIQEHFDEAYNPSSFKNYHYGDYRLANYFAGRDNIGEYAYAKMNDISLGRSKIFKDNPDDDTVSKDEESKDILELIMSEISLDEYYTDFYINPNISYSETFQNSTKPSMMAGLVQGASEFAKEISFLISAGAAQNVSDDLGALSKTLNDLGSQLTGGSGLIQRMLSGATTILSGANLVFPEIWTDSPFSRSFNIEITLKTPYGNRESIFTDIIIPMAHWICLAAPRQASINTYGAPFLVKFHIPGFCSVDMGIVESLTITKGGDGSAWSVDGLPLEVQLSINIKDLYSSIAMSRINGVSLTDAYNMFWNTSYLDYIAIQSGLDMKQADHQKRLELAKVLAENTVGDIATGNRLIEEVRELLSKTVSGIANSAGGFIGNMARSVMR